MVRMFLGGTGRVNPSDAEVIFVQFTTMQKIMKIILTKSCGYSYESSLRGLSNEYQHDRVSMIFKNLSILDLWTKVASALEGLKG